MRAISGVLLCALFAAACSERLGRSEAFVRDVSLPAGPFSPGDEVTVAASGLESDDEIMFEIRWPLEGEALEEGSALGVRGVVTARTGRSLTFLAPGGYPASTVEVLLFRRGDRQSLGRIAVSDGRPPQEYSLYGVVGSGAGHASLVRIDMRSGSTEEIARRTGGRIRCAVNEPGSNRLFCISEESGERVGCRYDLTMRYWSAPELRGCVTAGLLPSSAAVLTTDGGRLCLRQAGLTRSSAGIPYCWRLPEGLEPGMLTGAPFVFTSAGGPRLLLAADLGDGTFAPVVLAAYGGGVAVGGPVRAGALIPFAMLERGSDSETFRLVGGYVVSDAGGSELRPFDVRTMRLGEPFARLEEPVRRAVALLSENGATQELWALAGPEGRGAIWVCDLPTGTWRRLPGGELPCSEIVLAR